MAHINVQEFYSDIVTRGRRNVPTYNETRRDAAAMTRRLGDVVLLRS